MGKINLFISHCSIPFTLGINGSENRALRRAGDLTSVATARPGTLDFFPGEEAWQATVGFSLIPLVKTYVSPCSDRDPGDEA